MIRKVIDVLTEASKNAKQRDIEFIQNMFNSGKNFGNIANFGIMTPQNPASGQTYQDMGMTPAEIGKSNKKLYNEFKKTLKSANLKFVNVDGVFAGNNENSFLIVNVDVETMKYYCGEYDQTSFWYCYPQDGSMVCEYWEKENSEKPYDKKTNQYKMIESTTRWEEVRNAEAYTVIGKKFKFTLHLDYFEGVNESLKNNLDRYRELYPDTVMTNEQIIEHSMRPLGGFSSYRYRKYINN